MKIHTPILSTVEKAVQDEMREAGREVLKNARAAAPRDTGALRRSGSVRVDDLSVQISFKGKVAAIQHENLDYKHDEGGPKFLESAALEYDLAAAIAAGVKGALGG